MEKGGLAIILFSATADRLIPVGVLSQAAANMDVPVKIFVTGWATNLFRKNSNKNVTTFPKEYESMAPILMEGLKKMNAPSWFDMLKSSKEYGDIKIYVCSLMAGALDIKSKDELDPIVDDIIGAAAFLEISAGYQTLFI
ncbi:MAG: DsrE/DsrF/DrsH-like family protein [Thermoplasmata archaeon]